MRAALFNICAHEIEGASFLDLCAGSGAVGFEALSRGAAHVTFVDSHPSAISAIRKNAEALGVAEQTTILRRPAQKALTQLKDSFDIIFVDPPYDSPIAPALIEALDQKNLLSEGGLLFFESPHSPPKTKYIKLKNKKEYGNTSLHIFTREI